MGCVAVLGNSLCGTAVTAWELLGPPRYVRAALKQSATAGAPPRKFGCYSRVHPSMSGISGKGARIYPRGEQGHRKPCRVSVKHPS